MTAGVRRTSLFAAVLSAFVLTAASCLAADDAALTGTWYTPDGEGTFKVRRVGDDVWWVGKSAADDGKTWTNSFHGTVKDTKLTGKWANVNAGDNSDHGTAALELVEEDGKVVRLAGKVTIGGKESDFTLQRAKPKGK